jgi:hypothetical protein
MYKLFVPGQAVGANLVYFDLWNTAASGVVVQVMSCNPIVVGSTAVSGVVGIDLFLTRTTAVGTGGTAATIEGTSLTACTFSDMTGSQLFPTSLVSARLTPTGGGTAGAVLSYMSVFGEETNSAAYNPHNDLVDNDLPFGVTVNPGTGIRVVQSSIASAGNVAFNVLINLK